MDLSDLISSEAVLASLPAKSKKQALSLLSEQAAKHTRLGQREIFDTLLQRERLGSTGVGQGVAIPHGRIAGLDKIFCLFARLDSPIDFESIDDQPVDLIFLLLAPESAGADHLKALSRISRLLREPATIDKLRSSDTASALYSVLTEPMATHAA